MSQTNESENENDIEKLQNEQYIYDDSDGGKIDTSKFKDVGFSKGQLLLELISQMKSGKDLYRISLPAAFICPVSMLEYVLQFIIPNEYIFGINEEKDPMQRMLRVIKWWFSNMCHLPRKGFMHCKPYNPILGEFFRTKIYHPENDSETWFFAEQVKHHPPISRCWLRNKKIGITLDLTLEPKSKFHGNSVSTILDGKIEMNLDGLNEKYVIQSFPWVLARSLVFGTQYLELWQFFKIKCESTDLFCSTEFFWKNNNSLKGKIKEKGKKKIGLTGSITNTVYFTDLETNKKEELLKAADVKTMKIYKYVIPTFKQEEDESRKVWHDCSKSLYENNYSVANSQKSKVEKVQRIIREERKKKKIAWNPKFFKKEADTFVPNIDGKYSGDITMKSIDDYFKVDEYEIEYLKKNLPKYWEKISKEVQHAKEIGEESK